ncbi:unnamed protein product [Chondrus crispus]|uniref:protein-serine/threonine phosphatase n=1 Tax=Chondrus crispus TaxID=2769 RepID=R7QF44_CHOCR|nr:unnamed protein product [Chondrus crispus]CDF36393.1 unnamed protein product [Chondrus crispus]|eukprot:XP_005716212.1 unnamed protein product [Chondrus crispus]
MTSIVDQIKAKANDAFKSNRFADAAGLYTWAIDHAIETNADGKVKAVLYSNRSATSIKLEQYGYAIIDATAAIEMNPGYVKGYYRRAGAQFALTKYKEAKKDYALIIKMLPGDKDALLKLKECDKRIREIAFAKAIESDSLRVSVCDTVDVATITVDDSYSGPRIQDDGVVTEDFIHSLVDAFKAQKTLHLKYAMSIILAAKKIMDALPNIVEIPVNAADTITVCGDVHGQYYDLTNAIFKENGMPSATNPYVFNGDFVDRGSFSVEVILTLLAIKVWCPEAIHLTRGNHESQNMNRIYGFQGEVQAKYTNTVFSLFSEFFQSLPLAFILDGSGEKDGRKAFIVHGGLFSKDGVTLDEINQINRNCEPDSGIMSEMLWSDPQDQNGWGVSKRGIGVAFGPDVTHRFLDNNGLDIIVRSHEMKDKGYEVQAEGRLITIFSAPNYCDQMGNQGAFIKFDHKMEPKFVQFSAVPVSHSFTPTSHLVSTVVLPPERHFCKCHENLTLPLSHYQCVCFLSFSNSTLKYGPCNTLRM